MIYRLILVTSLFLIGLVGPGLPPAHAASESTWYWQNPRPQGDELSAIACPSATRCVAGGLGGFVATTTDSGQHWTTGTTGTAATIEVLACPGPTVCYALGSLATSPSGPSPGVSDVLLESSDGGASWQMVSTFQGITSEQPAPSLTCPSPTTCLLGLSQYDQPHSASILRSGDSGKTWQREQLAGISQSLSVVCSTSTICYALGLTGASSTLLGSRDGGKTWSASGIKSPRAPVAIACPGKNTCFIIARTCQGACWGIYRTTNGAKSWKKVADSPGTGGPGSLTCPNVNTCYVLETETFRHAYNTSVAESTNSGRTWSVHDLPDSASGIVCSSGATCLLEAGFTVLATRDGFRHIQETLALSALHNLTLTDVSCPTITRCYAAGMRHVCDSNGEECDQIAAPGAVTTNGGRSWAMTAAPPTLIGRLSCPSTVVCYAIAGETGDASFIERSGDGARTWRRVFPSGGLSGLLTGISCPSVSTCFAAATVSGRGVSLAVLVTHNSGKTWTAQREVDALAPGSAATAEMSGRALVRLSCISVTTCFVLAASFKPPPGSTSPTQSKAVMAMLFTGDGGKTWTRKSLPDMNAPDGLGDLTPPLACPTVTTCYLLLSNGSTLSPSSTGDVLVTHNSGATWRRTVVQAGAILTDIACPAANLCRVAGWDGIFATADGGVTWQRQEMADGSPMPQVGSIACPGADTCYAVGGQFWTDVTIIGTRAPGKTT